MLNGGFNNEVSTGPLIANKFKMGFNRTPLVTTIRFEKGLIRD